MTEAVRILIVDDSEDDRQLYRRALQKNTDAHYAIVEANDGEQGLLRIEDGFLDCILLDYSLPGRNGIEILKRLRVTHPFVPVVMLTGQGNETIAVAAMREGAQDYITKSAITPETIQRAVRVAIEHCAMEKRIHEQRNSLEIFTRALAHDLKEPVRTIKSFLSILAAHETLSTKGQGHFQYIQSAADRMIALIDAVYFYTRLDGSPQQIGKEICDVAGVLAEAKENIVGLIGERNAAITSSSLPQISANRTQLLQLLQNLICNAIHHCETDPVIRIDAVEDAHHWLFRIADNGPGIEEAQRAKIFEPFKRLSRTNQQGLGLGLSICRKIVELHGGKLWYEPGSQGGAVFLFTLPKDASAELHGNSTPDETASRISSTPDAQLLANVLLVDDNEADIELARIMLIEEAGLRCNLTVAHDGHEALKMLRRSSHAPEMIDLMLLDINMPGMDGFELLKHLRSDDALRNVPVVMCTTSGYDKDISQAKKMGVMGYLTKPADLVNLKPVLESVATLRLCKDPNGYSLLRAA